MNLLRNFILKMKIKQEEIKPELIAENYSEDLLKKAEEFKKKNR